MENDIVINQKKQERIISIILFLAFVTLVMSVLIKYDTKNIQSIAKKMEGFDPRKYI